MKRADATAGRLEAGQVRAMFDRVAVVYDLLNTVMTAGLHHRWRTRAVEFARVGPGSRVLDVATGTGDLAIELLKQVSPGGEVVGSDFSENMLARARVKGAKALVAMPAPPDQALSFEWADALELPYPDDCFDAATVGFGARNFSDLGRGLQEMVRVVRPGGRVVVLEMTTPTRMPLSLFFKVWFDRVVPLIGKFAALASRLRGGSAETTIAIAYTYLPNSVKRFHSPRELAAEMERAGCTDIAYVLMAGGIIALHGATVSKET
ncbi:MAG TPA: ubiquinone/menaquinone biosynthesis methyltransferase [Solirubrobacteraceae bacterium]|jgi:demethylmenaquinone methyltransferase/2-methoxy-6-polyprenyl-1,4-benzoquinol methylase